MMCKNKNHWLLEKSQGPLALQSKLIPRDQVYNYSVKKTATVINQSL